MRERAEFEVHLNASSSLVTSEMLKCQVCPKATVAFNQTDVDKDTLCSIHHIHPVHSLCLVLILALLTAP